MGQIQNKCVNLPLHSHVVQKCVKACNFLLVQLGGRKEDKEREQLECLTALVLTP